MTETAKTVDGVDLIPTELRERMLVNGARTARGETHDPHPVVRLLAPPGHASWLLTELDPDDTDLAYGLCDAGVGAPRLDYIRLTRLMEIAGHVIERDAAFVARQPLSGYLREAREAGTIRP